MSPFMNQRAADMTSEESSFSEITECEFAVAGGTDWSNDTAIRARDARQIFEQGTLPSRAGFLRNTSDCLSTVRDRHGQKRVVQTQTPLTRQVYASAQEDIARLNQMLSGHQCTAVMRGGDG